MNLLKKIIATYVDHVYCTLIGKCTALNVGMAPIMVEIEMHSAHKTLIIYATIKEHCKE